MPVPSRAYCRNLPIPLVVACGLLAGMWAGAQEAMPKTETGGDCSTCHSSANPSKDDLLARLCRRPGQQDGKPAEPSAAPDFFILKELSDLYVPVVFPHRLHASMEAMGDGCEVCHHHTEKGKIVACQECHSGASNPDNLRQPGLKGAYHRQCLSCHREWSHDTDCVFCHAKRVPGDKPDLKPDPSDILGRLHPNVAVPEKHVYPTPNLEEGTLVTFHHKEHVELFGRRCVDCHRKENCSRCHDTSTPTKHVKEDPHQDCTKCHDVSDQCDRCHQKSESTGFDHFRRSGFTLMRYHAQVACQKCHAETKGYKGLPRDCQGCHRVDWTPKGFDHAKTGLTLDDKHSDGDCQGCHTDGLGKPARCDSCHDDGRKFPDQAPGTVAAGAQLPGMPAAVPPAPSGTQ